MSEHGNGGPLGLRLNIKTNKHRRGEHGLGRRVFMIVLLVGVGELMAFGLTIQALAIPGRAYKQAHRSRCCEC
jgi:hypothetical protein